jgi:hypothetical protein
MNAENENMTESAEDPNPSENQNPEGGKHLVKIVIIIVILFNLLMVACLKWAGVFDRDGKCPFIPEDKEKKTFQRTDILEDRRQKTEDR